MFWILYFLPPITRAKQVSNFIIETQKGSPKSSKFFYWLSKFRGSGSYCKQDSHLCSLPHSIRAYRGGPAASNFKVFGVF